MGNESMTETRKFWLDTILRTESPPPVMLSGRKDTYLNKRTKKKTNNKKFLPIFTVILDIPT